MEFNAHASSVNNAESTDASDATEKKETREQTDLDIDKFNLLVTSGEEKSQSTQYQRQSRGRVQNLNVPVELEPKFVLTYYDRGFDVRRPVYYSEIIEKSNNKLGLDWILKVTNNEAPLNEMQIQTHFRSIQNYSVKIENEPENGTLYFARGMDFMQIQDYENAIKDFNRAIELNPDMLVGYFARALLLTGKVEYDYQLSDRSAFSDMPNSNQFRFLDNVSGKPKLPEISIKSVKYDEILRDYEEIIRIDPDFIYAYYNRAEIFTIEKDYRAAIADYSKAIEIESQFAEAYFNRGISRLAIGETSEGLDDLRKAGELGIVQSYSIIKRMQ